MSLKTKPVIFYHGLNLSEFKYDLMFLGDHKPLVIHCYSASNLFLLFSMTIGEKKYIKRMEMMYDSRPITID